MQHPLSPFRHLSYVKIIKEYLQANRALVGAKTRLAEAAGCQLSHLSQVLSQDVNLTFEQGAGIANYFGYSSAEAEYFLELIALERAGTPALKEIIQKKIARLVGEQKKLSTHINEINAEVSPAPHFDYYQSWMLTAIHMLITVEEYQTEQSIVNRLGIPIETVRRSLAILNQLHLAEFSKNRWRPKFQKTHVSRESPLHSLHHNNWRIKSIEAVANNKDLLSYTAVHTMSKKDLDRVLQLGFQFIKDSRTIVESSREEELVAITFDFFNV